MAFNHLNIHNFPELKATTTEKGRRYRVGDSFYPSVTTVIGYSKKDAIVKWRKKVGNEKADKITKAATTRGTDYHTLTEYYLKNDNLPEVKPISEFLFKISKSTLGKIDNIHSLEGSLYSKQLGIAGTVDCIA